MQEQQFIQRLKGYYRRYQPQYADPQIKLDWINTQGWESKIYAYTLSFGQKNQRHSVNRLMRLLTGGGMEKVAKEYRS